MGSAKTTSFWVWVGLALKFKWELIPSLITKKIGTVLWIFVIQSGHLTSPAVCAKEMISASTRWSAKGQDGLAGRIHTGLGDYLGSVFKILCIKIILTSNILYQNNSEYIFWNDGRPRLFGIVKITAGICSVLLDRGASWWNTHFYLQRRICHRGQVGSGLSAYNRLLGRFRK